MPDYVRTDWLIDAGFSGEDLKRTAQEIEKARKDRRTSITKSDFRDKTDVLTENVKRTFGRVIFRKQRSDVLYQEWKEKGGKTASGLKEARRASL